MNQMNETFLMNLLSSISVSGYEEPVQEVVEAEMKNYADEIRRDEESCFRHMQMKSGL